jgi:hypothetical protein
VQWGRSDSTKVNFQVKSPLVFWRASTVSKIYLQAAFKTSATSARFIWRRPEDGDFLIQPERYVDFPITGDGEMRVYELDLGNRAGWSGVISQIGLEATPRQFSASERREVLRLRSVTAARP